MRKLATFYRKQAVFGGVMERDDEGRALQTCIATLEKVESPFARRRIVRYLVERYVSPEEDVHALAMAGISTVHVPEREGTLDPPPSPAESVAIARAHVLGLERCARCNWPEDHRAHKEPFGIRFNEESGSVNGGRITFTSHPFERPGATVDLSGKILVGEAPHEGRAIP